jgi:hypothetical protein
MRASDLDRRAVQRRLAQAHADGLITLDEFDARVGEVWQARTRAELTELTADLPEPPAHRVLWREAPVPLRVVSGVWLAATVFNLAIWALVCVTMGQFVYPWWAWVAVPPGAVLGGLWWTIGRGESS